MSLAKLLFINYYLLFDEIFFLDDCLILILIVFDALRDLVAFVQFKKRGKHQWRSVNFSKVAGLQYVKILILSMQ